MYSHRKKSNDFIYHKNKTNDLGNKTFWSFQFSFSHYVFKHFWKSVISWYTILTQIVTQYKHTWDSSFGPRILSVLVFTVLFDPEQYYLDAQLKGNIKLNFSYVSYGLMDNAQQGWKIQFFFFSFCIFHYIIVKQRLLSISRYIVYVIFK